MMTGGKIGSVLTTTSLLGTALSGSISAADPAADGRSRSMEPEWVQELTIESDFTVFMAPEVPAETQRQAMRKLWRLLEWEEDGLNCYESDYAAIETMRRTN